MLKIYGVCRSRASRNIWLAEELGIAFEHIPVIQAGRLTNPQAAGAPLNTHSPAFLAVNPMGQIPSIDDDGLIINQSLAINLYLAKKHGGPLAPANVAEDGLTTMWTLWAAADVEPYAIQVLYNRVAKPPAERDAKLAEASVVALVRPLAVIEEALAGKSYLVGERFTVADINVAEVLRYAQAAPELFEAAPNTKAWLARCQSRPAFKAMMAKRDAEPA